MVNLVCGEMPTSLTAVGDVLDNSTYNIIQGPCLIPHTKGTGKCVGLYRVSEYSGFILVDRNTLGP
jgi:hypothetical protein